LIIAAPGLKKGATASGIVELLDLYPTLIEFAGLAAPHKLEGASLKPLLQNPKAKGKEAAFTVVNRPGNRLGRTVRTDRWRYTEWEGGASGVELYDHQRDPGEYHNLANDAQWARVKAELKQRLQK
jgi:iduronate 2-sulfatase